jgi:hypothetical protein
MVRWPASKTGDLLKVVLWSSVVPLSIGLTFHLPIVVIVGSTVVIAATYLGIRTLGRRSRGAHDVAVADGFSFGDAVRRRHEAERVRSVADAERREETARMSSARDVPDAPAT